MRTTTLGSKGPDVGVLGLGCMGMSFAYDMAAPRDDEASISVIRQALDLDMTLLDTADVYGPYVNEELVGRALSGGHRDRAVLATKVGLVSVGGAGEVRTVPNGRPEHIRTSIDESLRRLGTDHVDLYQLHRVDPNVPLEETWGAMAEAVAAGKARYIGLSEANVDHIKRAQSVHPVTSVQSEMSLWTRECRSRRWARGSSRAGSLPSTTCPRTTSGAGCPASSRMRCAPTWPSRARCGRSPSG
jgi:aryl-alcohol dehydrogenase-like predicted oxidoreductase